MLGRTLRVFVGIGFALGLQVLASAQISTPSAAPISNFYVMPSSGFGGSNFTGVVQLAANAGINGSVVSLASKSASVHVPSTVKIPTGENTASFTITTSWVASPSTITLTATYASFVKNTTVTLYPSPI